MFFLLSPSTVNINVILLKSLKMHGNTLAVARLLSERRLLLPAALTHVKKLHSQKTSTASPIFPDNSKFESSLKNLVSWKNKDEFVSCLVESVFFHHDGLVALSKPYGVAVHKSNSNAAQSKNRLTRSKVPETKFTVEDALPALKQQFQLKFLEIMKSTERFTTGICVLATNQKTATRFKAVVKNSSGHLPYQSYWAVTKHTIVPPMYNGTVGYKLVPVEDNEIEPEVIWNPTRRQAKLRKLKMVSVEHQLLSSNNNLKVGLCQVNTTTNKAHFVRVYLIQRSCCVLGDTLYSARLRSVFGRPVVLSPQNYNKNVDPLPKLNSQVIKNLGISCSTGEEMAHLPVMLHLRSLKLARWNRDKDLVLTAPLPEHFKWVCKQFSLDVVPGHQENVPLLLNS